MGTILLMTSERSVLAILEAINKAPPTGGVINPIHKLNVIMIPKWIGSIPIILVIGNKMGVKINTAADISKNIPAINKIKLINNKIIIGLSVTDNILFETSCGIPEKDNTQESIPDAAIKNKTIPLKLTVSEII